MSSIISALPTVDSKTGLLIMFMLCRWRDVKLRAFENADHRTYVDLKVHYFFPSPSSHKVPFNMWVILHGLTSRRIIHKKWHWSYFWLWLIWYCPYDYFD